MTYLDQVLARETEKWRKEPYAIFEEMKRTVHNYSIQENNTGYEVEIHTKKGTRASEIIVMIEVSKSTILGAFFGKAKYFIVSPNGTVRDAADDEFF